MRIAVTVWNDRIAPVFDSSGTIVVVDADETTKDSRTRLDIRDAGLAERAAALAQNGVAELICGAITREAERAVQAEGILVHPFVAGELEAVLGAWRGGALDGAGFCMPGCGFARRRRGRRGGYSY